MSNGTRLFTSGDGRSSWSRRYRDVVNLHAEDLGGADTLSAAQLSLIRRAATLSVELEQVEAKASQGEPVDLDIYGRTASHLRRLLETLGLKRVARDVTPSVESYLQRILPQEATQRAEDAPASNAPAASTERARQA